MLEVEFPAHTIFCYFGVYSCPFAFFLAALVQLKLWTPHSLSFFVPQFTYMIYLFNTSMIIIKKRKVWLI